MNHMAEPLTFNPTVQQLPSRIYIPGLPNLATLCFSSLDVQNGQIDDLWRRRIFHDLTILSE